MICFRHDETSDNQRAKTLSIADGYASSAGVGRQTTLDELARPRLSLQGPSRTGIRFQRCRNRQYGNRRGSGSAGRRLGRGRDERSNTRNHRQGPERRSLCLSLRRQWRIREVICLSGFYRLLSQLRWRESLPESMVRKADS